MVQQCADGSPTDPLLGRSRRFIEKCDLRKAVVSAAAAASVMVTKRRQKWDPENADHWFQLETMDGSEALNDNG